MVYTTLMRISLSANAFMMKSHNDILLDKWKTVFELYVPTRPLQVQPCTCELSKHVNALLFLHNPA
jgi:hypothetical protein